VILGGCKTCVVHTTTRKLDGKVWIIYALSMKMVPRDLLSHLFAIVVGEVDEGGDYANTCQCFG
jgi:hypothetical protein